MMIFANGQQFPDNLLALLSNENACNQTILVKGKWLENGLNSLIKNSAIEWDVLKLWLCQNSHPSILLDIKAIHFEYLISLEISDNKIESIEALSFLKAPFIEVIYLDKNDISCFNSFRKIQSRSIKGIHFENNRLGQWPKISEVNWKKLQEISVESLNDRYQCYDLRSFVKLKSKKIIEITMRSYQRLNEYALCWKLQVKFSKWTRIWTKFGQLYDPQPEQSD